jgi:hypothetical protein
VAATSARAEPSFDWSLLVAVFTAAVLALAVETQVVDTPFYSLWEAAALWPATMRTAISSKRHPRQMLPPPGITHTADCVAAGQQLHLVDAYASGPLGYNASTSSRRPDANDG